MKINHVLYYLEWLKIDKERKYEKYMQLCSRTTSPQSALHNDDMPRSRDIHARERLLTESSDALTAYLEADKKYNDYLDFLESNFKKLEYRHRIALEIKYINNLDRPREKRGSGISRFLGIRRAEVPALIRAAKEQLKEVLRDQGLDIE